MARNFIYYVAVTIAKLRLQLQSCDYPEKIVFVAFRISNNQIDTNSNKMYNNVIDVRNDV